MSETKWQQCVPIQKYYNLHLYKIHSAKQEFCSQNKRKTIPLYKVYSTTKQQPTNQRTHNNIFTQCRIILPILSLVSYTYWISSINIYVPIDYIYLFLFYLLFLQSCTRNNGFFVVILFCTCIYIYSIIHSRIHLSDKPACR